MPITRICVVADVPADRVWAVLSEYGTWGRWLTHVRESHIEVFGDIGGFDVLRVPVGAVRSCGDVESPRVRERLVSHDDVTRTISYEIAEPPVWRFPGRRYRGTARVISLTDREGSVIEWFGTYDCDKEHEAYLNELLTELYQSFVNGLVGASTAP